MIIWIKFVEWSVFGSEEKVRKAFPETVFSFIYHYVRQYRAIFIVYAMLAIMAGFWGPCNSLLIKQLINLLPTVVGGEVSALLLPVISLPLNFILFDNFTWRGMGYIKAKFIPLIMNQIVEDSTDCLLGKSHRFYQESLSGKLSKQISYLADGFEKLTTSIAPNFLRGASLLLSAIITAYWVDPIFSVTLVVWFLLFATVSMLMSKKLEMLSDAQALAESTITGELVDSLSNHSSVRIFSRKCYETSRMAPFFSKQEKAYRGTLFHLLTIHSIQGALIAIMIGCSCYFLISLYSKNLITVGDFALILGLSMETGHMTWFTMSEVDEFNKAAGRCKQSLLLLGSSLEIVDTPGAALLVCTEGRISCQNLLFHYPGTEKALFQNLSLEIKGGEKVGVVGYSGGGKSTFVHLMLRLYELTDGAILIDGQNIREISQDSLRAHITFIPQDPSLFHRSLMENIRYGRIGATDEEVIEAAKKAHADEFISKLPEGYASLVGERGVKLSGGQRQRVAIARAILKNSPILILDEATSQLDSVTEGKIQESLSQLMEKKSTIVIAHRLSTLLQMNRIILFHEGKVLEDGTHSELLAKGALYSKLWNAQVGGFLGDKVEE